MARDPVPADEVCVELAVTRPTFPSTDLIDLIDLTRVTHVVQAQHPTGWP